ncbi:MAG: hypothetical protein APR63_04195 [Desulfuromonas sp. SDB]|nr:MAG: hypothetical protein APR63_04195 [Desulfuromonas sp. SDB]
MFLFLVLCSAINLSLPQAESLAVVYSSEIQSAHHQVLNAHTQYRAEVLKFFPKASITAYLPTVTYSQEEVNYPAYPNPIDYWKRTEQGIVTVDVSMLLPVGGNISVSYDLTKINEISNLYEDERYYQSSLTLNISQPLWGSISPYSSIRTGNNAYLKSVRNYQKTTRNVLRNLRSYYIDFYIYQRVYQHVDTMVKLAQRQIDEIEYLYQQGYVDDIELLQNEGKLGLMILKGMEIESEINQLKDKINLIIGIDQFNLAEPKIPEFNGEIKPDIWFELQDIQAELEDLNQQIIDNRRENGPSLEVSGYYGFRGREEEVQAMYEEFRKNRWGVSVGINIPLLDLPSRRQVQSLEHLRDAYQERENSYRRELNIEITRIRSEKEKLLVKLQLARTTFLASEKVFLESSVLDLSASEQLEILEDYTDAMEYYGSVLKELYLLDINFEEE